MSSLTIDIVLVALMFVGFVLFGLAMFGLALRVGPRRGTWNQPAAALARPGKRVFATMYLVAALHVVVGLVAATAVPGGGMPILIVLVATAVFYVLCAHSFSLAHGVMRRR